MPKIVAVEPCM